MNFALNTAFLMVSEKQNDSLILKIFDTSQLHSAADIFTN